MNVVSVSQPISLANNPKIKVSNTQVVSNAIVKKFGNSEKGKKIFRPPIAPKAIQPSNALVNKKNVIIISSSIAALGLLGVFFYSRSKRKKSK